jgi:hypothetical protein
MSDILYSNVDDKLRLELQYRGRAGSYSRSTHDLQFMLEKIASVRVVAYKSSSKLELIPGSELGGYSVRGGEYLPSGPNGFITDRKYTVSEKYIGPTRIQNRRYKNGETIEERTNSSRRTPPYIKNVEFNINDHSNGLLNDATIDIVIPNPERDLNFIESIYFRPGRNVNIEIAHPDSAVITRSNGISDGFLSSSLKSSDTIRGLFPNLTTTELRKYQKLNSVKFDGVVISFTIDYQSDMSVNATITLRGTSTIYTDTSLIINETTQTPPENQTDAQRQAEQAKKLNQAKSFFTDIQAKIDKQLGSNPFLSLSEAPNNEYEQTIGAGTNVIADYPYTGAKYTRYIQLGLLVRYISDVIQSKISDSKPIILTSKLELGWSTYYEHACSADPMRVFISSPKQNYGPNVYGQLKWMPGVWSDKLKPSTHFHLEDVTLKVGPKGTIDSYAQSACIYVSLDVIQENIDALIDRQTLSVNEFLKEIGREIEIATAGAVNMKLITHPENDEFLVYYDCNATKFPNANPVIPFNIPMGANSEFGTIVRDFKFSGKLPQDAANLAYVVSSDPSKVSESDVAPFIAYMYSANTINRSGAHESIDTVITQAEFDNIKKTYKETHEKAVTQLKAAKEKFGTDPQNSEFQSELRQCLTKYIQFPSPSIVQTNQLIAPVIPFDVEFTIDGINGFRYGDILSFTALPSRYTTNAVFPIVGVKQSVNSEGQWTTTIRCIMRPKIEE